MMQYQLPRSFDILDFFMFLISWERYICISLDLDLIAVDLDSFICQLIFWGSMILDDVMKISCCFLKICDFNRTYLNSISKDL